MTLLCSSLYIAALYAGIITTPWHTSEDIGGPAVNVETCQEGFGLRVAASDEWVQAGPQFGYAIPVGVFTVILKAHGGYGDSNTHNPRTGVRQVTKWNGGLAISINYGRCGIIGGYDHMSNGQGHAITNAGQDLWSAGVGCSIF